jgi:mannose-6-phosphate isomerase-like protein (cupin superfamily)
MIDAEETHAGGFSLVEHPMPPRALAAPLHRHSREDEYSYALEGRMGALLGDDVLYGEGGDLVHEPRDQWHSFWNAGDEPCRILEIIAPGRLRAGLRRARRRWRRRPAEAGVAGRARRPLRRGVRLRVGPRTVRAVRRHLRPAARASRPPGPRSLGGMDELGAALEAAGGLAAGPESAARLRALLADELRRGEAELGLARSGYGAPVTVAVAPGPGGLRAVAPVASALRADPNAVVERAWLLVAALTGALVEVSGAPAVLAGALGDHLALAVAGDPADAELVPLAFEGQVAGVDRLRARALAVPGFVLDDAGDLRPPIGAAHPLVVAATVAGLGGRPADAASLAEHEDAVLAVLEAAGSAAGAVARPHDDPDPARRVARRILQRLHGMGKWGGYHTEFAHLARGFAGNDRALAEAVGEALLESGLLAEKPSVGQRHVFLNPRRAGDIHALIERGEAPSDLRLPAKD